MYCENCGDKINIHDQFCVECGHKVVKNKESFPSFPISSNTDLDQKWWHRLLKVVYIILYLPLLIIIPLVWSDNSQSWSYYEGYTDTKGEAFWYSVVTLIIYFVITRLIKIAVLYVAMSQKPHWKKEFKKLF